MKKSYKLTVIIFCFIMLCLAIHASADTDSYIVKIKEGVIPTELTEILTVVNAEHGLYTAEDISCLDKFGDYIEYLETNDEIMLIEGMTAVNFRSMPSDAFYSEQWQSQMVNADFVWDMETYGNEVNVAVIDSGCNSHEDINIAGGYNFVLNNDDYTDNDGHGTHVAGIICAQHNDIGIAGIAPKVNIYALKCVDPNYKSSADTLVEAIYAAVDTYNCKVINMSLGTLSNKESLYEAVKHATDNGVIIIAAVGNEGNSYYNKSRLWYPAAYDEVIGVGSVGISKGRSYFSQQNNSVFVVAPGEAYKSIVGTMDYDFKSGTSQAAPVVTAAAALLLSADNKMTLEEFKNYIINCSEAIEDEYCGYGLLNIEAMFKECIKDTDYYVSPINSDGVLVYNNTENILNAIAIVAEYEGEKYVSGNINDIVLLPYKKVKINSASEKEGLKFFLWSSSEKLKPLAEERSRN